jgi:hypothetical protein
MRRSNLSRAAFLRLRSRSAEALLCGTVLPPVEAPSAQHKTEGAWSIAGRDGWGADLADDVTSFLPFTGSRTNMCNAPQDIPRGLDLALTALMKKSRKQ